MVVTFTSVRGITGDLLRGSYMYIVQFVRMVIYSGYLYNYVFTNSVCILSHSDCVFH